MVVIFSKSVSNEKALLWMLVCPIKKWLPDFIRFSHTHHFILWQNLRVMPIMFTLTLTWLLMDMLFSAKKSHGWVYMIIFYCPYLKYLLNWQQSYAYTPHIYLKLTVDFSIQYNLCSHLNHCTACIQVSSFVDLLYS